MINAGRTLPTRLPTNNPIPKAAKARTRTGQPTSVTVSPLVGDQNSRTPCNDAAVAPLKPIEATRTIDGATIWWASQRLRDDSSHQAVCAVLVSSSRATMGTPPSKPAANGRAAIATKTRVASSSLIRPKSRRYGPHSASAPPVSEFSKHVGGTPTLPKRAEIRIAASPTSPPKANAVDNSKVCCRSVRRTAVMTPLMARRSCCRRRSDDRVPRLPALEHDRRANW